jgi:type IV secretory pathway VirB9-like protein
MQKTPLLMIALAVVAQGQTIQTKKSDPRSVIQVKTTLNHLSVIELAEPVTDVAVGSQSYEVTRHGNKVFVEPLEPEAATNLFIWTSSGRFTYELVSGTASRGPTGD